ncbi:MAG: protein-glutamate O-methyltransferase CheR [Acidobacteria bacterium]|nr:protein-glutamate O-methyltransferase CheR [Acidobacteriota bacterium]
MTSEEFNLFRTLIYDTCGIDFQQDKSFLLENRLRKRMQHCGISSYIKYYYYLTGGLTGSQELITLVDSITINETNFFRNRPQFDLLETFVLPELILKKKQEGEKRLRIWSAGCSSGQEPYSIAITLLETIPFIDLWDIKILASDISLTILEVAQTGRYLETQLRGLEQEHQDKYFLKNSNGEYFINERVKKLVAFDYHNLKHDNGLRGFDIIFCRNVMIYFDQTGCINLVNRFANSLLLGGYLFIGHAETLKGLSTRFKMVCQNKGIAYRKET